MWVRVSKTSRTDASRPPCFGQHCDRGLACGFWLLTWFGLLSSNHARLVATGAARKTLRARVDGTPVQQQGRWPLPSSAHAWGTQKTHRATWLAGVSRCTQPRKYQEVYRRPRTAALEGCQQRCCSKARLHAGKRTGAIQDARRPRHFGRPTLMLESCSASWSRNGRIT